MRAQHRVLDGELDVRVPTTVGAASWCRASHGLGGCTIVATQTVYQAIDIALQTGYGLEQTFYGLVGQDQGRRHATARGAAVGAIGLARALAHIEGRYGAHALARGDAAERHRAETVIPTGTSLDQILRGGLAVGEPIAFIGPPSVGKVAVALRGVVGAQAQGGMVAWIDPTASFDPLAAQRARVDLDRTVVVRTREVALATAAALRSEGFRIVVVDMGHVDLAGIPVDDLAPALVAVRGSPAALLVIAGECGRRVAVPTYLFEHVGWERKFGRTVGWSFSIGLPHASDRAFFSMGADGGLQDLGTRADLAEVAV